MVSVTWQTILQIAAGAIALSFLIFWIYHILECLRRPDYGLFDKLFWTILLLVPIIGLIMYRGIGNEFYKKRKQER